MNQPNTVTKVGNIMSVAMDDGTEYQAVPTGYGVWLVSDAGSGGEVDPPDPGEGGEFRFPFARDHINFVSYFGHSGIDFPGANVGGTGTVIKAVGPGTVIGRTVNSVNDPDNFNEPTWRGNSITIDHGTIGGRNIQSLYAHMVDPPVMQMGDVVVGGQIVGFLGNSGASSGAHLHLEIIFDGQRLPTSTPGNNTPGLGFTRTLEWLDANAQGTW